MSNSKKDVWFPAKKYGWGWGFPVARQGWSFLAVWIAVVFSGVIYIPASGAPYYLVTVFVVVMALVLIAVCFAKGEKPSWRWGK